MAVLVRYQSINPQTIQEESEKVNINQQLWLEAYKYQVENYFRALFGELALSGGWDKRCLFAWSPVMEFFAVQGKAPWVAVPSLKALSGWQIHRSPHLTDFLGILRVLMRFSWSTADYSKRKKVRQTQALQATLKLDVFKLNLDYLTQDNPGWLSSHWSYTVQFSC